MCKASNYRKMTHKRPHLSTALLPDAKIYNQRCKIVEPNKCREMANCS